ncbi:MAG: MFS transporter, partial [Chloroflexota bacterium]|nr:MFS transporter [Chloroflexota bacterium]
NFAGPAPFFTRMARDFKTTVPLLGQITTAITLLSASLGLAIGPLAERFGYRRLITGGMIAVAVNLIGTALAPSYSLILGLAVIGGLGDAALFGLPLAIASTYFTGAARRRAISWTMTALPASGVAGIPLLTLLGGAAGWRVAIGCAGVIALVAAGLTARWLPGQALAPVEPFRLRTLLHVYLPLVRKRSLLLLYGANGLRMAGWIGLLAYLGAFLTEVRGFGTGSVSAAYFVVGLGAVCGGLAATRLGAIQPRTVVVMTSLALAPLCWVLFLSPLGTLATIALLAPLAVAAFTAGVGIALMLADETATGAASVMVLNGSVLNVGAALGVALGGLLLATGGYTALGMVLPFLVLIAAGLIWSWRSSLDSTDGSEASG